MRLYTSLHTRPRTDAFVPPQQDWFHESCLNLREQPPPRVSSPDPPDPPDTDAHEDDFSDVSTSGLPPPLISADDYDSFVCAACVSKTPTLRRYAGTKDVIMVVRDGERGAWKRLQGDPLEKPEDTCDEPSLDVADFQPIATKRPRSRSASQDDEPETKKARVSAQPCLAPAVNLVAQAIFGASRSENSSFQGTGDIFLTEGFRERWCRCERVSIIGL